MSWALGGFTALPVTPVGIATYRRTLTQHISTPTSPCQRCRRHRCAEFRYATACLILAGQPVRPERTD